MKLMITTFLAACFVAAASARAQQIAGSPDKISEKRISIYEVPLVCPAAPQIGCGSASKPLLLELERHPAVAEAWLNRAGTLMAIVWSEQSKPKEHARTLKGVLKQREMTAKELSGKAKEKALTEFASRRNWYRGAEVDRLSEEEADVIASRWIGRFREKIVLTDDKVKTLQEAFAAQIKRQLTGRTTREEAREEMLKIARQHLGEKDVDVLLEAFGNGLRAK